MVRLTFDSIENKLSELALNIGLEIRKTINGIPYEERAELMSSKLKGEKTRKVDAVGEDIAIERMATFAQRNGIRLRLIVDVKEGETYDCGSSRKDSVYCVLDPVDGTIKVAGLESEAGVHRTANDGLWAASVVFTPPTNTSLEQLTIGDFKHGAIVDGNPPTYPIAPTNAFTHFQDDKIKAYELLETDKFGLEEGSHLRVISSLQKNLAKGAVFYDAFQAYDRASAPSGSEDLAAKLFRVLINRHEGGAFDVWRNYSNACSILRNFLGNEIMGHPMFQSQTTGYVAVNDNPENFVPIYTLVRAAKGKVTDFANQDLGSRRLIQGRSNVIASANSYIQDQLYALISKQLE